MKISILTALRSAREQVELARAADRHGIWGLSVPDTTPLLYQGMYPTLTAALLATKNLNVGQSVTNAVVQHWAVHVANARALQELAPGRYHLGIATGDGAVHSLGMRPARMSEFEASLKEMAPHWPQGMGIMVAGSGPRVAEVAGRNATDFTIGTGLDPQAIMFMADKARAARRAAGITAPLRIWAFISGCVMEKESDVAHARSILRGVVMANSRYTFSSGFEGRNVPEQWQPTIRERLKGYQFGTHAKPTENPNARLFEGLPDIMEYLQERMMLVGTAEQCAARLRELAAKANLDGVRLSLSPWEGAGGPLAQLERSAKALRELQQ